MKFMTYTKRCKGCKQYRNLVGGKTVNGKFTCAGCKAIA